MKKDKIYLKSEKRARDFEFNSEVAEIFDDMLVRSIPFYLEQQAMIRGLCRSLWIPGTNVYDLGCSTATTLIGLCRESASLRALHRLRQFAADARARAAQRGGEPASGPY